MRTVETTVFYYVELSPAAQAKARDWFRELTGGDTYWSEYVTDDATHIAKLLGWELSRPIAWDVSYSQGSGASFVGTWDASALHVGAVKAHAPDDTVLAEIADTYAVAKEKGLLSGEATRRSYTYCHEHTVDVEGTFDTEDVALSPGDARMDAFHAWKKDTRRFMQWIHFQLIQAHEHETSDENIAETIIANEYEFYADGSRARE